MQHLHLIISGLVQGVGFRAWALNQAREHHLTGWVRNQADGSVEIVTEGEKTDLEKLISACYKGPDGSRVENIDIKRSDAVGEMSDFSVVY